MPQIEPWASPSGVKETYEEEETISKLSVAYKGHSYRMGMV